MERSQKNGAVDGAPPPRETRPNRRGEKRRRQTLVQVAAEGEALARATPKGGVGGERLNTQEEKFCRYLQTSPNATDAAIRAGYSANSARSTASRLLTRANIQRRVADLHRKAANQTILRKRDALRILSIRAGASLADFLADESVLKDPNAFWEMLRNHPKAPAIRKVKTEGVLNPRTNTIEVYISEIVLANDHGNIHELGLMLGWHKPEEHKHTHSGQVTVADAVKQVDGKTRGLPTERMEEPGPTTQPAQTEKKGTHRWQK